ncbi:MAG: S8 family serine peptidase [Chloroflexia bacterium]|nr:S8 family serine peptidase [Chloroflexia bacterium]
MLKNFFLIVMLISAFSNFSRAQEFGFRSSQKKNIAPTLFFKNKLNKDDEVFIKLSDNESIDHLFPGQLNKIRVGKTQYKNIYSVKGLTVKIIEDLIKEGSISYVDLGNRRAVDERLMDKTDMTLNKVSAVRNIYPELTGESLFISFKEKLFDTTDIDFKGRCFKVNQNHEEMSTHATMMASIAVGGGNSGPKGKGVAWKANITSTSYADLFPDNHNNLSTDNISVQNHSYGVSQIENYYGLEAQKYDEECYAYPKILHVFSSGNSGTSISENGNYSSIEGFANLTGQFKTSKNTLCVGEIDNYGIIKELSSKGPAFDGRVKPELMAYGFQGSSESAAMVSGIALLVQEAYKSKNSNELPDASLVKVVLINSADDIGRPEVDFESGFGSVDALGAIKTVMEDRFLNSTITNGEVKIYPISVPENCRKLKVTLCWHDPDAEAGTSRALINDLDLKLSELSTLTSWEPWVLNPYPNADSLSLPAKRGKDHLNNVEQITIDFPNQGNYEIEVSGYAVQGSQPFSIAYEYENSFQWILPTKNSVLEASEPTIIRWEWNEQPKTGSVDYQVIGENIWHSISSSYDLAKNYIDWQVPETNSQVLIRIKTTDNEELSDTFLISKPANISVGLNCDDEAMIYWNTMTDAENYQIYRVENQFLEPFSTTTDTFVVLSDEDLNYQYYTISAIIDGKEGILSNSMNYSTQSIDCYFVRFISKEAITDSVFLDLELASNYKLSSLTLERFSANEFLPIQKIEPVNETQYSFYDDNPLPNRNVYRIKLERSDFKEVISDEETVYFSKAGSFLVFPNPIQKNQTLNIIDAEDGSAQINIYDTSGKLYYSSESDFGKLNIIPMTNFRKGMYIIEIKTDSGNIASEKLVVF